MSHTPTPLRRLREWVLLDGRRSAVTLALLAVLYVLLGPIGHALSTQGGSGLTETHTLSPLFTTQLSGVFLLVSIVVSINSLFVSNEQRPLGQQLDRIREVGEFRRELEATADTAVTPTKPAQFLSVLTGTVLTTVQTLEDQLADADAELQADVREFLDGVADQTERVSDGLSESENSFDIVRTTLAYDYGGMRHDLRRIRAEYDDLPEEAVDTIDTLLDLLEYFGTAREYFKTLYFGREFATLSKRLVYVTVPVIALLAFVLMHLNDLPDVHLLVIAAHTVGYAPFALLAAYVVRVATVSQRTGAAGQFVLAGHRDGPTLAE
ncbi:hypothetical protein [Haloarcula litorea]|uniref:hypothetical protein n=1 Tax=Haloarcula litorea TaxID=3032579 RepID=UPI0023E8B629|nr:hypothetical protein [Halomicroarcula sp. GDY20]